MILWRYFSYPTVPIAPYEIFVAIYWKLQCKFGIDWNENSRLRWSTEELKNASTLGKKNHDGPLQGGVFRVRAVELLHGQVLM